MRRSLSLYSLTVTSNSNESLNVRIRGGVRESTSVVPYMIFNSFILAWSLDLSIGGLNPLNVSRLSLQWHNR